MLVERMLRAARLDRDLYYELERDQSANGQAFLVVLIVTACGLIGTGSDGVLSLFSTAGIGDFPFALGAIFTAFVNGLLNWLFWVLIAVLIGMRFGSRAQFEQVMRPVAFAFTPGVVLLLGLVPGIRLPLGLIVLIWTAVAVVLAVREAMNFTTGQAILTALLTTLACAAIGFAVSLVTGRISGVGNALISGLRR